MTNSRNKAIPSSTYVPVRSYATTPWQVKIGSVLVQYASHIHDDVYVYVPSFHIIAAKKRYSLKLKFRQNSPIYTNYIICHCTKGNLEHEKY